MSSSPPVDTAKELFDLRTTTMWVVLGAVAVCTLIIAFVSARLGVYALAGLMAIVGTVRLSVPGAPLAFQRVLDYSMSCGVGGLLCVWLSLRRRRQRCKHCKCS